MEVEFPATLSNDISVTETLNTNRAWVREFAKAFESLGKDLWIVFPDASEAKYHLAFTYLYILSEEY
jgi:hypothetical protein